MVWSDKDPPAPPLYDCPNLTCGDLINLILFTSISWKSITSSRM